MVGFLQKTAWFIGGFIFVPVVMILFILIFKDVIALGPVPAAITGAAGLIGFALCKSSKLFLSGLLTCVGLIFIVSFVASKKHVQLKKNDMGSFEVQYSGK